MTPAGIDIVNLGLIYEIDLITPAMLIKMTLTTMDVP